MFSEGIHMRLAIPVRQDNFVVRGLRLALSWFLLGRMRFKIGDHGTVLGLSPLMQLLQLQRS